MTTVYTVGHSTRAVDELTALLRDAGVARLVDVRSLPRSRTNPQFNADTLPAALAAAGIDYRHMKGLGGLRGKQKLDRPSPNAGWRVAGFRNYADYALTPEFRDAFDELCALAEERPLAVMCAEAHWTRCHRRIIADYLLGAGFDVVHLVAPGRRESGRLSAGAEPQPDGTVHYPGDQGALL